MTDHTHRAIPVRWVVLAWVLTSAPATAACVVLVSDDGTERPLAFLLPLAPPLVIAAVWLARGVRDAAANPDGEAPRRPRGRAAQARAERQELVGCLRGVAVGVGVWIGHALLVALLVALVGGEASGAVEAGLIALVLSALAVPSGLCLAMILTLLVGGLWAVGALLCSGRPGVAAFAAFVPALAAGLLLMGLGIFGFDTPRRRDIRPLIGPVPDDVHVTSHALLLAGRCGMALIGLALLTPFAVAAWGLLTRRESDVPDVTPR